MAMATLSPSASMDEIKWVFDMCGFVLFPSLLSEEDVAAMVAEVEKTLAYRQAAGGGLPDGLHMAPGVQRRIPATHEQVNPGTLEQPGYLNYLNYGGRCGELLDHPLLNVFLNELLGDGREMNGECYNFRCDDMMTTIRRPGKTVDGASASNAAWISAPEPHNVRTRAALPQRLQSDFYLSRGRLRLEVSLDSGRRVTQLRQLCLAAAKSMRTRGWWWRKCISRWRDGGADARTRA